MAGADTETTFDRRLLIIGAGSVVIKRHTHTAARPGTWLGGMLARKPGMLVRVALANSEPVASARIVWAFAIGLGRMAADGSLARGGVYRAPAVAA